MTRFMLMQAYGGVEGCDVPMTQWPPEDVRAHIDYQLALNRALAEAGELVGFEGLTGPELAAFVTVDASGKPVVTDGPYAEAKELLAGYRVVDVESRARALEIAAQISSAPGPGGAPIRQRVEVRQVMDAGGADL